MPGNLSLLAQSRAGSLADVPFGALLFAKSLERQSISLEIRHRNVRKAVVLDQGVPVECDTNLVRETFGEFLVSEGRISAFQCKEAFAEAAERGVRIGGVLIERGFLDARELPGALQRSLGRRLLECFTWNDGEYQVVPEIAETTSERRVNVPRLVFTGLSRYTNPEQMIRWVGPLLTRPLVLNNDPPVPAAELRLPGSMRDLIHQLRSEKSLRYLLRHNRPCSKDELVRTLAALAVMGVVVVRRASTDAEAADALEPELADVESYVEEEDPLDPEPEPSPDELFRLRSEITVEHMVLARRSAYEVLGVTPDTPPDAIRSRYVELVEHYAPSRYEVPDLQSVASKADDLLRATVIAYREITDPQKSEPTEAEIALRSDPPILQTDAAARAADEATESREAFAQEAARAAEQAAIELERLAGVDGPAARFRSAEIAFSLDDPETARDQFLLGCSLWASHPTSDGTSPAPQTLESP